MTDKLFCKEQCSCMQTNTKTHTHICTAVNQIIPHYGKKKSNKHLTPIPNCLHAILDQFKEASNPKRIIHNPPYTVKWSDVNIRKYPILGGK